MFEYHFPSPSFFSFLNPWAYRPLLKTLQIQGHFITVYGRKTEELHYVLQDLKGRVVQGDDLEHEFIHNVHNNDASLRVFFNNEPHVHYTMPDKSIKEGVTDFITAIFIRNNPTVRQAEYQKILEKMENDRVKSGDAALPDDVQKSLAQIDTRSPLILSEDSQALIRDIIAKYGEYCQKLSRDRCHDLLGSYWHERLFSTFNTEYDEAEKERITNLLQPLTQIYKLVKALKEEPLNMEAIQKIQTLIPQVIIADVVKLEELNDSPSRGAPLQERLDFIARYVQSRLEYQKTWGYTFNALFNRISKLFSATFAPQKPKFIFTQ
ncbi:MAG TPA: hypothetical protein VFU89_05455 [Rhabdochlamydiaceae bacterium]|nr:hypothetical protein [Rhabdochlamydiaceae bacterium]